jgi:uncharacterized protein YhdP
MKKTARKPPMLVARFKQHAQTAGRVVRSLRRRLPPSVKHVLYRATHWTLHSTLGVAIAIVLIFVAAHLWLPTLAERKGEIESYISAALGNPVTLGTLDTYWDGLNPGVRVTGLRVQSVATGQQAIRLKELRLSLAWWPLLTGRLEINSLVLVEPNLTVERQASGRLRISGIETAAAAADTDFSKLLLSQKRLVIENGELLWLDRRAGAVDDAREGGGTSPRKGEVDRVGNERSRPRRELAVEERLSVKRVYLDLRNNGNRHRLEFRADFPHNLCADCRVSADIQGNPFHESSWRGEIGVQARALSTLGLPRILRAPLPPGLTGRFDLQLTSQWRDARLEVVEGQLAVADLSLPLPDEARPLAVQALDARLKWKGNAEVWRLDLSRLRLGLTRPAWLAGRLRLDVQPGRVRFDVERVDVADLAVFTATLPRERCAARLAACRATRWQSHPVASRTFRTAHGTHRLQRGWRAA